MPRQRTPLAKAKATGQADKHPERYNDRKQPRGYKLGEASIWMDDNEKLAWEAFRKEIPWLKESDRAHVEIACKIRGKMMTGEDMGIQMMNGLRSCIAQMGGNPSDISKVTVPDEECEDPTDAYFN